MKVFLATNVLIDYLLKREPFYGDAKKVFEMCLYKIDGFVTPHSLIDVFLYAQRTDGCPRRILSWHTLEAPLRAERRRRG